MVKAISKASDRHHTDPGSGRDVLTLERLPT
jgi:hypothetical protein